MSRIPPMPAEGEPIPPELNLRCTSCGYALTGLLVRICPECGEPFDPREAWLDNERSTLGYHFKHLRPLWVYVVGGITLVMAILTLTLAILQPVVFFTLPLVIYAEFIPAMYPVRRLWVRLVYVTICCVIALSITRMRL